MKRTLLVLMSILSMLSCSSSNIGAICYRQSDCADGLVCVNGACIVDRETDSASVGETDSKRRDETDSSHPSDTDTATSTESETSSDTDVADAGMDGGVPTDDTSPFVFRLDAPNDNSTFYRLQPVTFEGYASGPVEARIGDDVIAQIEEGDFSFKYAFETTGDITVTFTTGEETVGSVPLTIEANIAKVCLDPGWLSETSSSSDPTRYPAIINRKVAFYLDDFFRENGYDVRITVDDIDRDTIFGASFDNEGPTEQSWVGGVSLSDRVNICNEWNADYLISIQHDAFHEEDVNRVNVLYGENPDTDSTAPLFSKAKDWATDTAERLHNVMGGDTGLSYKVSGDKSKYILQNSEMISIMTLASYYTNPAERERLNNNDYLEGEAQAIYSGFINTFGDAK